MQSASSKQDFSVVNHAQNSYRKGYLGGHFKIVIITAIIIIKLKLRGHLKGYFGQLIA